MTAWLENAELGLAAAEAHEKFKDLAYSAQFASQWLDENRVKGNAENEKIARRALRLFTCMADLGLLVPPVGAVLEPIRAVTIRLKGLI